MANRFSPYLSLFGKKHIDFRRGLLWSCTENPSSGPCPRGPLAIAGILPRQIRAAEGLLS